MSEAGLVGQLQEAEDKPEWERFIGQLPRHQFDLVLRVLHRREDRARSKAIAESIAAIRGQQIKDAELLVKAIREFTGHNEGEG